MFIFTKLGPILSTAFVLWHRTKLFRFSLRLDRPSLVERQHILSVFVNVVVGTFFVKASLCTCTPYMSSLLNHKRYNLLFTPATYYWFRAVHIHRPPPPPYITQNLCILRMQIRIIVSYLLLWFMDWFSFCYTVFRLSVVVGVVIVGRFKHRQERRLFIFKQKSVAPIYLNVARRAFIARRLFT